MEFKDVLDRTVSLEAYPQRIVSLVPSITETLFALGLSEQIVGVTDYCTYPKEALVKKVRVGGTKTLKLEEIQALRPDLILANVEENKKSQIEWLIDHGLNVYLTFPKTVKEAVETILNLGSMTGCLSRAQEISHPIQEQYARLKKRNVERRPQVLCLIWKRPYMSFNSDTFVHDMIESAGGENIFAHRSERYFRFALEELQGRWPDILLLPSEPYRFTEADVHDFEGSLRTISTPCSVQLVDGELITWHGPRLAHGLAVLEKIFSPYLKNASQHD